MPASALIVRVPEAEALAGALRERFDASARVGVPAHITLVYPFVEAERIDAAVLAHIRTALEGALAFDFTLTRADRFPATAWLAPEPAAPFIALIERLVAAFPAFPPFGGEFADIVPHLTVAHGDADDAAHVHARLTEALRAQGPVRSRCREVVLFEPIGGRWSERQAFALVDASGTGSDTANA